MKQTDPSPNHLSGTDWHRLGEIELRRDEKAEGAVRTWMVEILSPLSLHADFLNKILKSAKEAVTRTMHAEAGGLEFEHLHLFVFAPAENRSNGKTWGFFRIEKVESSLRRGKPFDHSIEFYLYIEG